MNIPIETDTNSYADSRPAQTRQSSRPLYIFFLLLAATLLNGLDSSEFTGAANVIARDLHLTINDIGMLASAFTLLITISAIPLGLLADRAKRSHVIGACLAFWSLATALTGLATNFIMLFLTRALTGIGEAGYFPAGNSLVGDVYKEEQRGKVMSWLSLASVIGPLGGLVLGGVVAGLAPGAWRLVFLSTGIPGIVLAFFAWRLREPVRHTTGMLPSAEAPGTSNIHYALAQFRNLLRIKTFVCLLVIGVLTTFTSTALQTYFPILLQQHDTFGMTSGQAGSYAGLILGPTAIVGVLLGGYLAPLAAALLDVVPSESRASAVAISLFIQRILGSAFAPLLIGMLAGYFDPTGLHFLHNAAGRDIVLALVCTCPLAFAGAGITSIIGLRWIRADRSAAEGENPSQVA